MYKRQEKTLVKLDLGTLEQQLMKQEKDNFDWEQKTRKLVCGSRLAGCAVQVLAAEDLLAFESAKTAAMMARSVVAWSRALVAWGVRPQAALIRKALAPQHGSYPKLLKPHASSVYQADKVHAALNSRPELVPFAPLWRGCPTKKKS